MLSQVDVDPSRRSKVEVAIVSDNLFTYLFMYGRAMSCHCLSLSVAGGRPGMYNRHIVLSWICHMAVSYPVSSILAVRIIWSAILIGVGSRTKLVFWRRIEELGKLW
jgi:hypothetical protein